MNSPGVPLIPAVAVIALFFLFLPWNVGASHAEEALSRSQAQEKYRLCFQPGEELDDIVARELALEQLKRVDGVKAGPYKVKELVKDDPLTDMACDQLPSFLAAICWGRTLGKYADELLRQPALNKELTRQYVRYLKIEVGECKEGYQPQDPRTFIKMPSGLGKGVGTAVNAFMKGAGAYCAQIRKVEDELTDLRRYCIPVPDLKGKTYEEAKDHLLIGLPEGQRFSSDLKVLEGGKEIRYPSANPAFQKVKNLKVIGQEPPPGVLVDRRDTNLAVRLQPNVPGKLVLTSMGKPVLSPGGILQVKVEATFTNGEVLDVTDSPDCRWKGDGAALLRIEKGSLTLDKTIDKEQTVSLSAVYTVEGKSVESNGVSLFLKGSIIIVPDLSGKSLGEAKKIIANLGLSVGGIDLSPWSDGCGDGVPPGTVDHHHPHDGNPADLGEKVDLELAGYEVPDILGVSEADATQAFQGVDLDLSFMQSIRYDSSFPEGFVNAQKPDAGKCLMKGTKVVATLNGFPTLVGVPDLIGKRESEARDVVRPLSLLLDVRKAPKWVRGYDAGVVVDQDPPAGGGTPVNPGTTITVWLNPSLPSIGIDVVPDKRSYQIGESISFAENVWKTNPNNTYTFTWMKDGEFARKDDSFTTSFDTPGGHYVQLILESSDPEENDALIRTISVEYPPDPTVGIDAAPAGLYTPGARVTFSRRVSDLPDAREFRWYVNGTYIDSGTSLPYKLGGTGKYEITLDVRRGNGDELKAKKTITVGDEPIKPFGKWINRFEPEGTAAALKVCSSYWKAGYAYSQGIGAVVSQEGRWSKCATFDTVGAVDGYDLYTGEQADTYNSGWIVYAPAGGNTLLFSVYSFRFGDPDKDSGAWKGYTRWKGSLDTHGTLIPSSITFVRKQSRAGTVQWQTDDGKTCTARIYKFAPGGPGTITQTVFVTGGVDYEQCEETGSADGGYNPADDPGMGNAGNATAANDAKKIGQQFQGGGSTGSGGGSGGGSQGGQGNLSNVTVSQKNVTITFWDHGQEDGDIINIYLNGSLLKGNVTLKKKKSKIDVTLNSGSNTFEVEAVNEGTVPPNTASVRISNVTKGRGTQIYKRQSGQRASMNLFAP